jgi:sugar phosphate isomerase/epimerase
MTRREILAMAGVAPAWFAATLPLGGAQQGKTRLGGAVEAFHLRAQGSGGGRPFDMVEHCHQLGLGGVQTSLGAIDLDTAKALRKRVEGYGMRLVLAVPQLASSEDQLFRFDNAVKVCKATGAYCLHAVMTQRRWEQFDSIEAFQRDFARTKSTIGLSEPMLAKNKIKLAIENHTGWSAAEQAEWMKDLDSEWVGVCFDFGNNIALGEDPMDTVRTLAPYTLMSHIKDVAVDSYAEGFLLSEVPLSEGILNLKEMSRILREKDPNTPFYSETITGDPLKVPVLTDKYWATFDKSSRPSPGGQPKILDIVRKNPPKKPLPQITGLSPEAAVKLEDDNNLKCIEYARQVLNL